ncbi:MAG: DUF2339 domain-containing protein [candidate division KSB1 bacterium]|nr:DUF2339 domain-containing protein [candidate division KSB1 bacterium]MDZ7367616.1 DUF2339 domain-containing protein [candidate division KSB1 bacterium]MDZ7405408.1 DUF2339 domain-containing protein [candidate division KSB1 bacterium]
MNQPNEVHSAIPEELGETLRRLEARLARIETYLQLGPLPEAEATRALHPDLAAPGIESEEEKEAALERRIGEFWLARVGIVALLVGTAFFIAYPIAILPPLLHSLIGYSAVAGLFFFSRVWRTTYPYLSRILFGGGLILLYYATLRLHFFTDHPVIANKTAALIALIAVVGVHFYFAARRKSELLTGIAVFLGYTTALMGDTAHFTLPMVAVISAAAVYFLLKYRFQAVVLLSVVLAYLTHLLWLLGNPILGHPLQAVAEHQNNLVYLFIYAAIFALPNLWREEESYSDVTKFLLALLNGAGFYSMAFLVMITFFSTERAGLNFFISAFFLAAAILGWVLRHSRFATSFYACFGYLALSAAILARFETPQYFIWLGWQSLLVISTAIWFRSKIVVVANTLIYLGIFLAYLILAPSTGGVNVSYAIVALLSARLLNWKTERLALKTELMRNAYLASAFVIIPYGLYHAVPRNYVSLSWLAAAVFYFVMSLILKNKKYRWMAILTIFLAVIYVFVVDMAQLEAGYRILSFLALGVVLLVISLLYARSRKIVS